LLLTRDRESVSTCTRASIVGIMLVGLQTIAHAELLVDGSKDQVIVMADQASLNDVIDALGNRFNFKFRSSVALDVTVNGRYSGSLTSVLVRLLRSYDFVLAVGHNRESDPISIVVLGESNKVANTSALRPGRRPVDRPGDGGM
jgi:hypothetical protein